MSWSKQWHPISFARCVNTIIGYNITTFLDRLIWYQTSTRHLFRCTDVNQSWNKVSMCSPNNHHLLKAIICLKLVSPIWLIIVALSWLCFLKHPLLSSIFPCYAGRRTSSVKHNLILALKEFCKRNNICLLNNFLNPICKTYPHCLPPKLTFPNEP